jgi:hypothetical protein
MKTALIKQKFNRIDQSENSHYSNNQKSSSVNKFALQCFNKLSQNREINKGSDRGTPLWLAGHLPPDTGTLLSGYRDTLL